MKTYAITEKSLKALKSRNKLPWKFAPSLLFQGFIRQYGTSREKLRLAGMGYGYQIKAAK